MTGTLLAILGIIAITVLGVWFYHFVWPGLMKFRELRDNIIQKMETSASDLTTTYGMGGPIVIPNPPTEQVKASVKANYHDLASQLGAFQQNQPIAAWVASRWYDLNKASEELSKLSQSIDDHASHVGVVQKALRCSRPELALRVI